MVLTLLLLSFMKPASAAMLIAGTGIAIATGMAVNQSHQRKQELKRFARERERKEKAKKVNEAKKRLKRKRRETKTGEENSRRGIDHLIIVLDQLLENIGKYQLYDGSNPIRKFECRVIRFSFFRRLYQILHIVSSYGFSFAIEPTWTDFQLLSDRGELVREIDSQVADILNVCEFLPPPIDTASQSNHRVYRTNFASAGFHLDEFDCMTPDSTVYGIRCFQMNSGIRFVSQTRRSLHEHGCCHQNKAKLICENLRIEDCDVQKKANIYQVIVLEVNPDGDLDSWKTFWQWLLWSPNGRVQLRERV